MDKITIRKANIYDTGEIANLFIERFGELAIREGALSYITEK